MSNFHQVRVGDMIYTVPHHVVEDINRLVARYDSVSATGSLVAVDEQPSEVTTEAKPKKKAKKKATVR